MSGGDTESQWAHVLWQRRGIRFEDFYRMTPNMRLIYIASEMLEDSKPENNVDILLNTLANIKPSRARSGRSRRHR